MIMADPTAALYVYLLSLRHHMTQTETNIIKNVIQVVDCFKWLPLIISMNTIFHKSLLTKSKFVWYDACH